jgi:gliding motility-associated-like protein
MHFIKNKVITLLVGLVFSVPGFSQTWAQSGPFRIWEYSCSNVSGLSSALPAGGTPDWVEIHNITTSTQNIGGWYISNDPNFIGNWQFPSGTTIPANGYLVVYASGLDTAFTSPATEFHTGFDFLQTKPQKIILSDGQAVVKDSLTIRRTKPNDSWAWTKTTASAFGWRVFACDPSTGAPTWTPGAANPPVVGAGAARSFKGYLAPPDISTPRGFYSGNQQVTLSIPNSAASVAPNARIFYLGAAGSSFGTTHPGGDPGAFNNIDYTGAFNPPQNPPISYYYDGTAISIDSSTVLRFFLDTADLLQTPQPIAQWLPSFVETHSYFIDGTNILRHSDDGSGTPLTVNTNFTLPVISIAFDSTTSGNYPGSAPPGATLHEYKVSLEYFDKNKNFRFGTVGFTTPGTSDDQQIPFNYVGFDYSANDELGYSYTNKYQLYTDNTLGASSRTEQTTISLKAAGSDNFPITQIGTPAELSAHLRDPLCQTYGMKSGLDLDGLHYQPCILYINGQYNGIYDIREKFDREWTKFYYGTDSDSIQVCERDGALFDFPTPTAFNDWSSLVSFITTNDMRNDSLRHIADSLLDFGSLIDLIIYNGYTVNNVFPQKAAWWRAPDSISNRIKWRYRYYDMEDTYGLGENLAGLTTSASNASVCQQQNAYGANTAPDVAHLAIFTSLMQSDTFKSQFINRYSYLLNTSLRCPPIIAHLQYIRNLLKPEIIQHATNMATTTNPFGIAVDTVWNYNIDSNMVVFINQRCPTINEDIKTCYNVNGPWSFCTDVEPVNSGTVYLNTVGYPDEHSDMYFGNVWFDAVGVPNENYVFDHWELDKFTLHDSISLTNDSLHWLFDTTSCIKAFFKLKPAYETVGEPSVPTGFSPNGDGINDMLNVYGTLNVTDYNLQIYSRWGQKLWESSDKTKGWDGTFKGQEAPVGVYAYVFKVTTSDGKQMQKSGNITLIR